VKILQLVPRLPYPPDDGGKIGIAGILEAFTRLGHVVTIGGFDEEQRLAEAVASLRQHASDWFVEDIPASRVLRSKLLVGLGIAPYVREKYFSPSFARRVLATIEAWKPDVLHVDHSHMGSYALLARQRVPSLKFWVRAHNVESTIWERRAAVAGDALRAAIFRRQAVLVRQFETKLFEAADGVLAISDIDAQRIREQAPHVHIHEMAAGCDLKAHGELRAIIAGDPRFCFVGSLEYSANTDGLAWFVAGVWPAIRAAYPSATLVVAGRSSSRVRFLESVPGVSYVGFVADVRTVTDHADIAVVPLRIGGGMRVKILDFMSRGMPIIATRIGAEGIPSSFGARSTLRLADSADEYLQQIRELLPLQRRAELAATSRELIDKKYAWTALVAEYCRLIQQPSRPRAGQPESVH
jgi:glycosyltransferase involved in cell wall biosynthesis